MKKNGIKNAADKKEIVQSIATRIILDSIADGVFTVDQDWNITSFNRAAERITGTTSSQAIGRKCFEVLHADICQSACAIRSTLKTGKETIDQPVNILNRDGEVIPISISTAVLKDEKGNTIGGVETFRDLSALETLKKEILRSYSFQDIISKNHDLRTIFGILPDIAKAGVPCLFRVRAAQEKSCLHGPSITSIPAFAGMTHY